MKRPVRRIVGSTPVMFFAASLALVACSGESDTDESVELRTAALGTLITLNPSGYTGPICIGGFGCVYGTTNTFDIPDGTHPINLGYSVDLNNTSAPIGSLTVNGTSVSLAGADAIRILSPSGTTLTVRLEEVADVLYDNKATVVPVQASGFSQFSPTTPVRLLRGRRYRLISGYTWHPQGLGAYFSATYDLQVESNGTLKLVDETDAANLFVADPTGATLRLRDDAVAPVSYNANGSPVTVGLWGFSMFSPGTDLRLIRRRQYRLLSGYSWHPAGLGGFFSTLPDMEIQENGSLRLLDNTDAFLTFEVSTSTLVLPSRSTVDVAYNGNGCVVPIGLWGFPMFSAGVSQKLIVGRQYRMLSGWSWHPQGHGGFISDKLDLEVRRDQTLALLPQTDAISRFQISGTNTLVLPATQITDVTYDSKQSAVNVGAWGFSMFHPTVPVKLMRGRRYFLLADYSWHPQRRNGFFSTEADLEIRASDGALELVTGLEADGFFENQGGRLILRDGQTSDVTYLANGSPVGIYVWGFSQLSPTTPVRLLRNRLYRLLSNYSWHPQGHGFMSSDLDLLVEPDGDVAPVLGTDAATTFQGSNAQLQLRVEQTRDIVFRSNGSPVRVGVWGLNEFTNGSSVRLIRGRRYALIGGGNTLDINVPAAQFSTAADLELHREGHLSLVPGLRAATQFNVIPGLPEFEPRLGRLRIRANGHSGPICIRDVICGAPGADLDVMVIRDRRYLVDPPGTHVSFPSVGTCTPQTLTPTTLTVSCDPTDLPPGFFGWTQEGGVVLSSDIPAAGPSFNDYNAAYVWMKDEVERLQLGNVRLVLDAGGVAVELQGGSLHGEMDVVPVEFPNGTIQSVDRLSLALGGLKGTIRIGGNEICIRDSGCSCLRGTLVNGQCTCPEGTFLDNGECFEYEPAFQLPPNILEVDPRCDGDFCTNNKSFRRNLVIYRSIGGETEVTSAVPVENVTCTAVRYGPSPTGGLLQTWWCECPGVSAPVTGLFRCGNPTTELGQQVSVKVRRTDLFHLSLRTVYFAEPRSGFILPAFEELKPKNGVKVTNKKWAFGGAIKVKNNGDPGGGATLCGAFEPVECQLVGACSNHNSVHSTTGQQTIVTTATGRVNIDCGL